MLKHIRNCCIFLKRKLMVKSFQYHSQNICNYKALNGLKWKFLKIPKYPSVKNPFLATVLSGKMCCYSLEPLISI